MKKMIEAFALVAAFVATAAFGHPNGTYAIDGNEDVTVTFEFVERCPADVEGALPGGRRQLTFSDLAVQSPYEFITGFYVEIHDAEGEVYVQTNEQCVPTEDGQEIPASRNTFAGYSLRRML